MRVLLAELDRANANPKPQMDCTLLGGTAMRYNTLDLRVFLSDELSKLLRQQILERERAQRYLKVRLHSR